MTSKEFGKIIMVKEVYASISEININIKDYKFLVTIFIDRKYVNMEISLVDTIKGIKKFLGEELVTITNFVVLEEN